MSTGMSALRRRFAGLLDLDINTPFTRYLRVEESIQQMSGKWDQVARVLLRT